MDAVTPSPTPPINGLVTAGCVLHTVIEALVDAEEALC